MNVNSIIKKLSEDLGIDKIIISGVLAPRLIAENLKLETCICKLYDSQLITLRAACELLDVNEQEFYNIYRTRSRSYTILA